MQFKYPEILYFLCALIVPILVHLFQLRKFKTEHFTNVKFLRELAIQTRKSSKIKKYLLLATRLLLLTFLIIAFAQPFFKGTDSQHAKNELYIILDNSYSMQAKGKKGELLKRAVQDLLEHTPEQANFSLITCSDSYWNTDIKSIQKDLQSLTYSATPFQLDQLLAKIKSHQSAFQKDIVVITDGVGLKPEQTKGIQEDEHLYFVLPEAEKTNNVSIDSVFIQKTMDRFYEIGVKLNAYGAEVEDLPIALYNNSKLVAKTMISFEGASKIVPFTIPKEDFHGYVTISDNSLDFDNQYYFSLSKPQKSSVLSIGEAEKSSFLAKIYQADEFNYTNFPLETLDYNLIDKQDAIVLNELKEIPQALQTTLKAFAEKGGNVIFIPNATSTLANCNAFLAQIGGVQFKTLTGLEKMVTTINYNHPLFTGVFEKKVTNFQYPFTKQSFTTDQSAPSLLEYNDQSPFLSAVPHGLSAVYIFTAPLNKSNSNFLLSPLVVPTFYKMGQNAQKAGITAMTIGNSTPYIVTSVIGKDEILTIQNTSERFIPLQQILNNKIKLTFQESPKQAGNYTILNNKKTIDHISFNYNRIESDITQVQDDVASDFKEISSVDHIFDTLHANRADNQIWKWFMYLTLLFLVLEVLIQKYVK
ncbi:vWA domain-containing protein [Flavobacterium aciduliphilum]|uniref:Putative membrane protein (TIGR02226 family) n=1 Tax=Flavobacterium aciduliphilum TaxID=1101402 RepID=A0A328YB23_9FLAO|nr:BatA and WFA domain-containing protein [Flavobacterium aciduliphilum]RAR70810.1 putative membrane protein (TIGR02226 family) [Flavobacterium aciduliphilum]